MVARLKLMASPSSGLRQGETYTKGVSEGCLGARGQPGPAWRDRISEAGRWPEADQAARTGCRGYRPPSAAALALLLTEPARGLADLAALPLAAPWLASAPRATATACWSCRACWPRTRAPPAAPVPALLGYDVRGWNLGRNRGPTEEVLDELPRALLISPRGLAGRCRSSAGASAASTPGRWPASIPRRSARSSPSAAPSRHDPRQSHADLAYRRHRPLHADAARGRPRSVARPIGVPSTAVYSRGRHRVLAYLHRARDRAAPECRGALRPPRLRRRPGHALAHRRPAGRPPGPAAFRPPRCCARSTRPPITAPFPARNAGPRPGRTPRTVDEIAAPWGARGYVTPLDGPVHWIEFKKKWPRARRTRNAQAQKTGGLRARAGRLAPELVPDRTATGGGQACGRAGSAQTA